MSDNQATFELISDVKAAIANVKEFEQAAGESIDHVTEIFETFKGAAEAALVFFGVEKIKEFASEAVSAAAAQEQGQRRLAVAMQLTGEYTDDASESMKKFAEELQANSMFSEEAATSALSIAKSFGLTNDQAKLLVQTSADMATQFGTDLDSQVAKLGRTFSGTTGRLTQMFPELRTFSTEELKAGAAVEYLSGVFEGAAEKGINTYAGASKQAANAQEDFIKSVGSLITTSPVMIARIEAMSEGWSKAKEWVEENRDVLQSYVNDGIDALVQAGPFAADVLYYLVQGFEAVTGALLLSADGFVQLVDLLTNAVADTVGLSIDGWLLLAEAITDAANSSPVLKANLTAMGVDIDEVDRKVSDTRKSFEEFTNGVQKDTHDAAEGMLAFTARVDGAFRGFDGVLDDVLQGIHATAQSIMDADEKVGASATLSGSQRNAAMGLSVKAVDALMKELASLDQALFNGTADASEKAFQEYITFESQISELRNAGIIDEDAAHDRSLQAEQIYIDKMAKIEASGADVPAEQTQTTIGDAAEAGIEAGVLAAFSTKGSGQQAAANFFSSAVNAGVTAYSGSPQLGQFFGQIMSLLVGSPEATKAWVKGFIEAVPVMVDNMGENIPMIVETIIGTVFSASHFKADLQALSRAIVWEGLWKSSGRAFGISVGDSLDGTHFGRTISAGWKYDVAWLTDAGKHWGEEWTQFWTKDTNSFLASLNTFWTGAKHGLEEMPAHIAQGFKDGEAYFSGHLHDAINGAAESFSKFIYNIFVKDIWNGFVVPLGKAIAQPFKDFFAGLEHAWKSAFDAVGWPPHIPTPNWLKDFTNAVESLTKAGSVGGGKNGGELGKITGGLALTGGNRSAIASTSGGSSPGSSGGATLDQVVVLLAQLVSQGSQPMTVHSKATFDGRAFADVILQLSRQNARLRA